uniref:Uncharacterized protein n=1 Tax=Arundo donax TaxID=35708 RepID=A0A0A9HYJ8_ARUDO
MFGIEKAELISHLRYRDAAGAVKHTGEEPFSDFMKVARRLTIIEGTEGRLQKPLMEPMVERAGMHDLSSTANLKLVEG